MIWVYIIAGAAIVALILGIFSAYNARAARRDLAKFIEEMDRSTQQLIRKNK